MKARVNGIDIHYSIEGEGPWITLSHSLACDASMWDPQIDMLKKCFKVLRFDTCEQDHGTPVEASRLIQANLPGSELLVIPSAAHISNIEQSAVFNVAVRDFLTRVTMSGK